MTRAQVIEGLEHLAHYAGTLRVPADEAQATVRAAIALLASPPVVAAEIEQVRAALAQLRAHIAAVREQMPRGDSCWACRAALAATPGELAAAVHPALIDDVPLATTGGSRDG